MEHLLEFGVKHIGLIVPPPYPHNTSIEQWVQYEKIRGAYRDMAESFPTTTTLIYIDKVFFSRRKSTKDIVLVDDSGFPAGINLDMHGAVYVNEGRAGFGFHKNANPKFSIFSLGQLIILLRRVRLRLDWLSWSLRK